MDKKNIILWLPINITYNYTFDHVSFKLQKSQFQIHSIFFSITFSVTIFISGDFY